MAISKSGAGSGLFQTSSGQPFTWTNSPTTGSLLTFRSASYNAEISATAVTTSGGAGTFNRDVGAQHSPDGEWATIHSLVAPSGVTSMTMAAGPSFVTAKFDVWTGNVTSSVLDTTTSNNAANATSGNTGTLVTGANAGLVLASLNCDNSNSAAPTATGSGWTGDVNIGDTSGVSAGFAYKIISSGSQQMTWTFPSTDYAAVIASYNASAGAPAYYPFRRYLHLPEWEV